MFCYHCGKPVPDGSAFCAHCGNAIVSSTTPPPVPPVYVQPSPDKKPSKKWLIAVVAGIAVIAIVLMALWISDAFGNSGGGGGGGRGSGSNVANDPESVAKAFVEAYILDDYRTQFPLLAWDHKDCFEDHYHPNSSFYSDQKKEAKARLKERYGDYTMNISVTNVTELSSYNLREYVSKMERYFGDYLDEGLTDTIDEGCIITVDAEFVGEERTEHETHYLSVVNCNGKWRVTDGQYRYGLATDDYFAYFYGYT